MVVFPFAFKLLIDQFPFADFIFILIVKNSIAGIVVRIEFSCSYYRSGFCIVKKFEQPHLFSVIKSSFIPWTFGFFVNAFPKPLLFARLIKLIKVLCKN